ncbi:MAG: hypothetical protein AB7N76_35990 [Planctomycetota bacterium]
MDERSRELERRSRAAGAPEDEEAWLRARLREGALSPERLELAAFLGHGPARAALGLEGPAPELPLVTWAARLADFGQEATVRASLAAGRATLARRPDLEPIAGFVLDAVARWLAAPGPETARDAEVAGDLAGLGLEPGDEEALEPYWAWRASGGGSPRGDCASGDPEPAPYEVDIPGRSAGNPWPGIGWDAGLPWGSTVDGRPHADSVICDLSGLHGDEPALRAAMRAALLEWALSD